MNKRAANGSKRQNPNWTEWITASQAVLALWNARIEFRQWQLTGASVYPRNDSTLTQSGRRTGPVRMTANGAFADIAIAPRLMSVSLIDRPEPAGLPLAQWRSPDASPSYRYSLTSWRRHSVGKIRKSNEPEGFQ